MNSRQCFSYDSKIKLLHCVLLLGSHPFLKYQRKPQHHSQVYGWNQQPRISLFQLMKECKLIYLTSFFWSRINCIGPHTPLFGGIPMTPHGWDSYKPAIRHTCFATGTLSEQWTIQRNHDLRVSLLATKSHKQRLPYLPLVEVLCNILM